MIGTPEAVLDELNRLSLLAQDQSAALHRTAEFVRALQIAVDLIEVRVTRDGEQISIDIGFDIGGPVVPPVVSAAGPADASSFSYPWAVTEAQLRAAPPEIEIEASGAPMIATLSPDNKDIEAGSAPESRAPEEGAATTETGGPGPGPDAARGQSAAGRRPETIFGEGSPEIVTLPQEVGGAVPVAAEANPTAQSDDAGGVVKGVYSEADVQILIRRVSAGVRPAEIARELNRDLYSVCNKIAALRKKGRIGPQAKPAAQAKPNATAPEARVLPPRDLDEFSGHDTTATPVETASERRSWAARVLDAASADDWCEAEDLSIVEGLTRGDGLDRVASRLNRGRAQVLARWRRLCPGTPSIDRQTALIAELNRRIADEEGSNAA